MADNLDPEVLAQFQEAMRQATDAAKALPLAMNGTIDAINKATNSLKANVAATSAGTKATEDETKATKDLTEAEKAELQAKKELQRVQDLQKASLYSSVAALKSFADGLLSGERGFAKYNAALGSAGDAALDFGKSLGGVGTVLGVVVKAGTMAASAMMKQADDVLKATDELSKMGAAGAFSAEEVRKMGTGLGLASDQLDKLVKPVKSLGSSLISLGGNAADGAKQFADLAKVTSEQRQAAQRLGISQEELIQNTADYVNLQTQQGRQITDQMKRDGSLRLAARQYTDNLLELAALTGKDIEAVKKKNELAMSEIETAIQNNLLDQEINRLRKQDTAESRARADQLEQERKARDKLLQRVENEVGDPALRKGLAKFLATGAITEEVAALKRIGVPIEDFAAKIKQGVDVSDQFMDSLSQNGDAMMRNVGTAAMFDENTRKAFGVSSEFMNYLAKARDRDEKAQSDLIRDRIAKTKAGEGPAGADPAQKARNALTEAEIAAKVALDDMVASMNPLLNNFTEMDTKVQILIAAVIAATAAIAAMGAAAGANAAKGLMGKLEGTALGRTGPVAKAVKVGGGLAAVGMGAADAYQAYQAGDKAGMAGAAGGTAGALAGGALGSLLGPVGTVLGGMAGQYFGEKLGKWAASWDESKDPKAGAAMDKAEVEEKKFALAREKYALEGQARDQSISEAERTLAQVKLRKIQKEEALLLNQEAIIEYQNAKTPEEKEAAKAKSDRARATLADVKTQEAMHKLETAKTEAQRAAAEKELLAARKASADVEIHRATQILKSDANEEEKKAAQARLDAAKKSLEEEQITIKKNEEIKKAEEDLKKAVTDEQKKVAQEKIKALKDGLQKELDAINKKYNKVEAKPAGQEAAVVTPKQGITVRDAPQGPPQFAGAFAEGGTIPKGKFGLVGERGPEFISGPAQITNQKQMLDSLNLDETTEEFIDTFYQTDKSFKDFDKELTGFVKDDPAGKMSKQLNLVTTALEDLNELINPTVPTGLELPGTQPKVPSASKIASAVMSQLSGMIGGTMPSGGGSAPAAVPAGSGDMGPSPKSKSGGVLGAIASALGFGSSATDSGGKDSGDAIPTPSGSIDMLDTKKGANVPVGNMSEDDIKKMIIRHEGVRYRPYKDSLGLWTVGIGHLIGDGKTLPPSWNREFSKEEVLGLFEKDYEHHRKAAERIPGFDKMNTVGQGALTDLTFNMGPYWINKWPNTKRKLEQGDVAGAAENLEDSKWFSQVGNRAPTIVNMVRQGLKAASGGIFSGPSTGYPVEMHGTELVTRLDPNSLLEKLAKMPAQQVEADLNRPANVESIVKSDDSMKELVLINTQMMEMMADKLDNMISKLDVSNDTQDKLLKFSQV